MNTVNQIHALAKQLGMSNMANKSFGFLDAPMTNEEFLAACLKEEVEYREGKAKQRRIKQAQLPAYKSFEEFDTDFQKGVTRKQLELLAKLEWVDGLYNLILIGPPGTGKTHIALAIGNKAANDGYNVAFHTMDSLVHILKTREISIKSQARLRWIKKCQILIIDELGYLPVSRGEANFFFALISELYENTSVVITSNKGFDGWAEILGDAVLATALLDRLTHRCQILNFTDESYRLANRMQIF